MAAFLLDTDTLTLFQHDQPAVVRNVAAHAAGGIALATVTATVEEQVGGWYVRVRQARTPADHLLSSELLTRIAPTWSRFELLPLTPSVLATFDQLVRAKLGVKRNDLRIAAVALNAGATLVTRNRRDFARVPNLPLADWSA